MCISLSVCLSLFSHLPPSLSSLSSLEFYSKNLTLLGATQESASVMSLVECPSSPPNKFLFPSLLFINPRTSQTSLLILCPFSVNQSHQGPSRTLCRRVRSQQSLTDASETSFASESWATHTLISGSQPLQSEPCDVRTNITTTIPIDHCHV